jgi:hypothetical protein
MHIEMGSDLQWRTVTDMEERAGGSCLSRIELILLKIEGLNNK